jgi:transcriptional regulator with XRE-family HTH domain
MEQQTTGASSYVRAVLDRIRTSGLSESEVCRRAGIAGSTLTRMKANAVSPTISTLDKIEGVLDRHDRGAA